MGLARMSVTMTDLDRLNSIQGFVDGIERSERVAERLGITTRQVRRLARRYRDQGPVADTMKLQYPARLHFEEFNRELKARSPV